MPTRKTSRRHSARYVHKILEVYDNFTVSVEHKTGVPHAIMHSDMMTFDQWCEHLW